MNVIYKIRLYSAPSEIAPIVPKDFTPTRVDSSHIRIDAAASHQIAQVRLIGC